MHISQTLAPPTLECFSHRMCRTFTWLHVPSASLPPLRHTHTNLLLEHLRCFSQTLVLFQGANLLLSADLLPPALPLPMLCCVLSARAPDVCSGRTNSLTMLEMLARGFLEISVARNLVVSILRSVIWELKLATPSVLLPERLKKICKIQSTNTLPLELGPITLNATSSPVTHHLAPA